MKTLKKGPKPADILDYLAKEMEPPPDGYESLSSIAARSGESRDTLKWRLDRLVRRGELECIVAAAKSPDGRTHRQKFYRVKEGNHGQ